MSRQEQPKSMVVCCPTCDKETHCSVEFLKKTNSSDEYCGVWSSDWYYVLRCDGCRTVFFFHQNYFSEDPVDEDGNLSPTTYIYPMPNSKTGVIHQKRDDIREALMTNDVIATYGSVLYEEICDAINNDHSIIGMFGIRSLLSEACRMKTGFNKNFTANLDKLVEEGFLATKQRDVFKTIIDIGNDTVHEPKIPSINTLRLCLLTIESLIVSLFIVPQHEEELKKVAPPSKPPKAKKDAVKQNTNPLTESEDEK